jgi:hypothetical protein
MAPQSGFRDGDACNAVTAISGSTSGRNGIVQSVNDNISNCLCRLAVGADLHRPANVDDARRSIASVVVLTAIVRRMSVILLLGIMRRVGGEAEQRPDQSCNGRLPSTSAGSNRTRSRQISVPEIGSVHSDVTTSIASESKLVVASVTCGIHAPIS